jgi:hypothetical protein
MRPRSSLLACHHIAMHRRTKLQEQGYPVAEMAVHNPKLAGIVDQISKLTLLETADLVSSLKVCVAC